MKIFILFIEIICPQGDPLLKMMLQWIAATMAQKELIFYCFGDVKLANEITLILQEHGSKSAGLQFKNGAYHLVFL